MKAEKLPSGSYRVKLYVGKDSDGKRQFISFTDKKEKVALQKALEYSASGKIFCKDKFVTVAEEKIEKNKLYTSPSTTKKYKSMLSILKEDYPEFCDKAVHLITSDDVQEIVAAYTKTKSPKTVKNYYSFIHSVLVDFVPIKARLPVIPKRDTIIPTKAEIEAILDVNKGTDMELFILLASYCMMREAEISALDMKDYNRITKKLHIHKTYIKDENNKWVIKPTTKTNADRTIEIPDRVHDKILEIGLSFDNPHAMYERFYRMLDRYGFQRYRMHDLRHFGASYFAELGFPIAYTQYYGGWKDSATLLDIYSHPLRGMEKEYYEKLNKNI